MDWINEPEEGVAPACGNCFFYAHGDARRGAPISPARSVSRGQR